MEIDLLHITLTMHCKKDYEVPLSYLRSQVVQQILSAKKEFCPNTKTIEKLAEISTQQTVSIQKIARSMCNEEPAVLADELPHTPISLKNLIHFEPYMCFSHFCLSYLYSSESQSLQLSPQFIKEACTLNVDDFCKVLNVVEIESGSASNKVKSMFQMWKREGTFQCLKEHLDKYSLFSGRNIFVSI